MNIIKINDCKYDIKKFIKENICKEFNIDYWGEWLDAQNYNILKEKPNLLVTVENSVGLIGIGSIRNIDTEICEFNSFYVKKEYRNKGIGTEIFSKCMQYAKDSKYKKIILCVDPNFIVAKKYYEKNGFIFDNYDEIRKELHYYKIIKGVDSHE